MSACLQINSQKWNLHSSDGLKLFLPRERLENSIYFQADWSFVPSDMDAAAVPADAPRLRLRLIGYVPGLRDWRDLENLFLGYHDRIDGESSETRGPDMWIWPPGENKALRYGHWETDLKFGERRGHEFDFSLEAIARSERAAKFKTDSAVKEFFGQPATPEWEQPEWINEGDTMSFAGRVAFKEIFCSVPINSAKPLEWAGQLARRELAMDQFAACTVHDEDCPGKFKLSDVGLSGRVVIFQMPPAEPLRSGMT